jgi:methionyl-tRNA formyltransferase
MKIIFMGTPEFSVPILEAVHKKYGVDLVVTQPDKLVGRKKVLTYTPVKELALSLGIEVFQPRRIKEDFSSIIDLKPDLIITAAYGQIIPKQVLEAPSLGAINVHGSLLPKLRGGAPIQRAIERRHKKTGITIMYMAQKMDSGDIISQKELEISPKETTGTLFPKMSLLGRDLLLETLPSIIDGTNERIPQKEADVTFAYNLKREEEKIDWNVSVYDLEAKLRAFSPGPYLFTTIDGKQLKILSGDIHECKHFEDKHSQQENGRIIKVFENAIGVKVKDGVFLIKTLQLAGKKAQDVKTFMNGAGRNLIQVNKVFQ